MFIVNLSLFSPSYKVATDDSFKISLIRFSYKATFGLLGRGYNKVCSVLRPMLNNASADLVYDDGSVFRFPLHDAYWNRMVVKDYVYEYEMAIILKLLKDLDYIFIDAGSNYGYWSILSTSSFYGQKETYAIEASAENFKLLTNNCELNSNRFTLLNNAVYDVDNYEIGLSDDHHTARKVVDDVSDAYETVKTITLDSVAKKYDFLSQDKNVVIKLDVEGSECKALSGSQQLLENNALFIYEDHGGDENHTVTRFIQNIPGYCISFVDENGVVKTIDSIDQLDDIKVSKFVGYNFLAYHDNSIFKDKLIN